MPVPPRVTDLLRRSAALCVVCAIGVFALGFAGCGDSSSSSPEDAKPKLTVPNDPVTPGDSSDEPTGDTGSTGSSGDNSGGTTPNNTGGTTPNNTGGTNNNTGGNNTGGSGGQAYDQFCRENPGACGD